MSSARSARARPRLHSCGRANGASGCELADQPARAAEGGLRVTRRSPRAGSPDALGGAATTATAGPRRLPRSGRDGEYWDLAACAALQLSDEQRATCSCRPLGLIAVVAHRLTPTNTTLDVLTPAWPRQLGAAVTSRSWRPP